MTAVAGFVRVLPSAIGDYLIRSVSLFRIGPAVVALVVGLMAVSVGAALFTAYDRFYKGVGASKWGTGDDSGTI